MTQHPVAVEITVQDPDPAWLKRLRASALHTDTLRSLLPLDPRFKHMGPMRGKTMGKVTTKEPDLVQLWGTPRDDSQARDLFLHEMGHVLQLNSLQDLEIAKAAFGVNRARDPRSEASPEVQFEQYPEWFADAFRSGIKTLNNFIGGDPKEAEKAIETAERKVPGTKALVDWLLAQPIYAEHPLAVRNANVVAKAENQFKVQ